MSYVISLTNPDLMRQLSRQLYAGLVPSTRLLADTASMLTGLGMLLFVFTMALRRAGYRERSSIPNPVACGISQ